MGCPRCAYQFCTGHDPNRYCGSCKRALKHSKRVAKILKTLVKPPFGEWRVELARAELVALGEATLAFSLSAVDLQGTRRRALDWIAQESEVER